MLLYMKNAGAVPDHLVDDFDFDSDTSDPLEDDQHAISDCRSYII